ncbi:MAG: sensor histidine kinase [Desulfonatronovibrionaceae bacterium]
MFENISWQTWVPWYLCRDAGRKIPGITHNLNNFVHIIDMQTSLLQSKSISKPESPISEHEGRIQKMGETNQGLLEFIQVSSNWSFYSQKERIQTGIPEFMDWLLNFWKNDLFFKHKIKADISLGDNLPHLDIPAVTLTFAVQEALSNAVDACRLRDSENEQEIGIRAEPEQNGVRVRINSPVAMDLDTQSAWEPCTGTKRGHPGLGLYLIREMCNDLGWTPSIDSHPQGTEFSLLIPEKKTGFKFE